MVVVMMVQCVFGGGEKVFIIWHSLHFREYSVVSLLQTEYFYL